MLGTSPQDLFGSPGSFTRGTVDDLSGLLNAAATSTSPIVYGTGNTAYTGTEATLKAAGYRVAPRTLTISTAAHTGSYKTGAGNKVTATGTVAGVTTSEDFLLTAANGGETIRGAVAFDDPTLCVVSFPGQNDALGQFRIGVGDIVAIGSVFRSVKGHAAGVIVAQGDDNAIDAIQVAAHAIEPVAVRRIKAAAVGGNTTNVGVTVYA
ncbi:MAG TPA: hypothetical protein VH062_02100 [Polyangiaceae bacterium]|jgi:hypothetical protein|nr:hypothetical protein [Polyangiaceae bacterium]